MSFWDRFMGGPPTIPDHVPAPDRERDLLLYKYDACGYCYRVRAVLDELEVEVPMRDTLRDPGARAELRDRTGRTQVPCLFIDGEPLFESEDIVLWLREYKKVAA